MTQTQLTADIQQFLERPFKPEEHDFVQGNVYIRKAAIRRRLSAADPNWSITEPKFLARDGDVVIYTATLTVCGVARANVGTAIVQTGTLNKDTGEFIPYAPYELARNVAKAHKQATSDCLPRCAQDFNVGWYTREMPRDKDNRVNNVARLKVYLAALVVPKLEGGPGTERALDSADLETLNGLCQKHVELPLDETLKLLDLGEITAFAQAHPTLAQAHKAIAARLVDRHVQPLVYEAVTEKASNGNAFLSLSFGFATVALFAEDVEEKFTGTPYNLTGWTKSGYRFEFQPPVRILMGRNSKGYPRLDYVEAAEVAIS